MQTVEFTTDKRFLRRRRELKIIQTMVGLYCRGKRHEGRAPLCTDCAALLEYATRRLERCVFGDAKPTCANCVVHCYRAEMREQIRAVMRWAGPRMMLRHPIMAIGHMLDERRPVPMLPMKKNQHSAMNPAPDPDKADPEHIRPDDPENLREWAARFGVSVAELTRIIAEAGRDPDKVRAYLNTRA